MIRHQSKRFGQLIQRSGLALLVWAACAGAALAVDVNKANQAELEAIPGIGPALSARILAERRQRPFSDLDDLAARVRGVGPANVRRMSEAGLTTGTRGAVSGASGRRGGPEMIVAGKPAVTGRKPADSAARTAQAGVLPARPEVRDLVSATGREPAVSSSDRSLSRSRDRGR